VREALVVGVGERAGVELERGVRFHEARVVGQEARLPAEHAALEVVEGRGVVAASFS
jgi:hypothetical protein